MNFMQDISIMRKSWYHLFWILDDMTSRLAFKNWGHKSLSFERKNKKSKDGWILPFEDWLDTAFE